MLNSVENANNKITEKFTILKECCTQLTQICSNVKKQIPARRIKRSVNIVSCIDNLQLSQLHQFIETIEDDYNLSVISALNDYYQCRSKEDSATREYYRIIVSENFLSQINQQFVLIRSAVTELYGVLKRSCPQLKELDIISKQIERGQSIDVRVAIEKRCYETCKCGHRMDAVPEWSELHCSECGRIKTIIGAVFRDDQFYPQDGQKGKHSGYDTSRHYRFWMERLQALEAKVFEQGDLDRIEYVINRDNYDKHRLCCEDMREILKDSKVSATHLNDHAPLLVKMFGGQAPPRLDFQENKIISISFNKAMRLYDIINPDGGNKPYYPYFIYKIIEHHFRDNTEKLRLLDYIHLQSRETVIKNDKHYKKMCDLADPNQDGLIYAPTDPGSRW